MSRREYVYRDASGEPVFRVIRLDFPAPGGKGEKKVWQERWDRGSWKRGLGGVEPVLYRLPEVVEAVEAGDTIHIVEGEKCADALNELGFVATTNPMGAGSWKTQFSEDVLAGAACLVWADCGKPAEATPIRSPKASPETAAPSTSSTSTQAGMTATTSPTTSNCSAEKT
ncbi:MAG: hypothetical protein OXG37_08835 [Actinomycetia bacterium]|nr:hypothetical protein [Actinomycetes bacterium]